MAKTRKPAKTPVKAGPGTGLHLTRVRTICTALPGTTEKLSHGAPTFFAPNGVFAMFVDNHHNDGHLAAWLPAAPGVQAEMIREAPEKYFRPPYVGPSGWIGVELPQVSDEELSGLINGAWQWIAQKKRAKKAGAASRRAD